MKIFITGATGYIGEQLALAMAKRQYKVVALVRSPEKAGALVAAGIKLQPGNLEDVAALEAGMQGCDAVFHLAAYARAWPEDEALFNRINVAGTRQVLEAAGRNNIKKVIITSTASVFGPSPAPGVAVNEETPNTFPFFSLYEASKAAADAVARSYAAAGMHVVLLHPARVYGPGRESESNPILKMIKAYQKGWWRFLPGDGQAMGSYCYISDVVQACIQALEKGRSGESYLLGGENVTYEQFFNLLQQITEKRYQLFRVPVWVLLQLSKLLVTIARATGTRPLITPAWTKKYMHDWVVSSHKAEQELHYNITPLKEGLAKTLDYIMMNNSKTYTLITGASAGIGKALAAECARRKQQLVLVALPGTGLHDVAEELKRKYGTDVKYYEQNLLDAQAAQELFNWCDKQSLPINILINNAGTGNYSAFETTPLEKYLDIIKLNSEVVIAITKYFLPKLKEHPTSYILNVGSFVSLLPVPYKSVYSATKSFVLTFSRALQTEMGQNGVHVSCLCPGPTLTEAVKKRNSHLLSESTDIMSMSPEAVAKAAIDGMFKKKGLIIPGWKNRAILAISKLVPFRLKSYILNSIFKDKLEQKEVAPENKASAAGAVAGEEGQRLKQVPGINYAEKEKVD